MWIDADGDLVPGQDYRALVRYEYTHGTERVVFKWDTYRHAQGASFYILAA